MNFKLLTSLTLLSLSCFNPVDARLSDDYRQQEDDRIEWIQQRDEHCLRLNEKVQFRLEENSFRLLDRAMISPLSYTTYGYIINGDTVLQVSHGKYPNVCKTNVFNFNNYEIEYSPEVNATFGYNKVIGQMEIEGDELVTYEKNWKHGNINRFVIGIRVHK